ncbi:MAG: hypothetical protein ACFE9S_09240 [Candidatus Hermodarchaeota archaeon]
MSNENSFDNSDNKKSPEKPFQKGWQNFIDGMKDGFEKFKTSLEDQTKKNAELWEENTEKVNKFFTGVKQDWDKKIQKWTIDMEQRSIETKEQWDAHKKKISQDFKNWQTKTKEQWEDGLKLVRKGFFRAYLWLLLLIIPVIVILVVVIRLIGI